MLFFSPPDSFVPDSPPMAAMNEAAIGTVSWKKGGRLDGSARASRRAEARWRIPAACNEGASILSKPIPPFLLSPLEAPRPRERT
ncbi:hypothetical protein HU200_019317 [Digitaria exilis]|uniref:Uncharacterized protein n=1 Tax=Digitaria exilis TaxID=1010633 RepID=A0A835KCS2_9POAL|nr:hypothetical protein HU200_019317 [Digitaria exilis]